MRQHTRPTWQLVVGCAFVVLAGTIIALVRPSPVLSDSGLISLVNLAYFPRTETLHELAHQRAEYQVTYSGGVCDADALTHEGLQTYEVLACNFLGPERAVEQWQGSPAHDAILSDPTLTGIGCASAAGVNGSWFFACVLTTTPVVSSGRPPEPTPVPSMAGGSASGPAPLPTPQPVVLLPDTATR